MGVAHTNHSTNGQGEKEVGRNSAAAGNKVASEHNI